MNFLAIIGAVALVLFAVYIVMEIKKYIAERKKYLKSEDESWKFGWDKEKPK